MLEEPNLTIPEKALGVARGTLGRMGGVVLGSRPDKSLEAGGSEV